MRKMVDYQPSLISRIVGAVMASTFAVGTIVVAPLILAWELNLKSYFLVTGLFKALGLYGFVTWAVIITAVGLLIGFLYGITRTLETFNLLWSTGESTDVELRELANSLRTLVPVTALISLVLSILSRL